MCVGLIGVRHWAKLRRERGRVNGGAGYEEVVKKGVSRLIVGRVTILGLEEFLGKSDRIVMQRVQGRQC